MLRVLLTLATAAAAPGAHAQQSFVPSFIESALRGLDCRMTEEQAARIFPSLGMTMDDTVTAIESMVAAGDASLSEDHQTLTLSPARCAAEAAPGPGGTPVEIRAAVVQVLRSNGCALTREAAVVEFLKQGIEPRWGLAAGRDLAATGEVTVSTDGTLSLTTGPCN